MDSMNSDTERALGLHRSTKRCAGHSRTVTVDDLQGLSLNEDVLSYDHHELALICEQHDALKPLAPVLKRIAEHHELKAMAYRIMAQRLVDEEILKRIHQRREKHHMRRQGITILLFLLTMLLLAGGTVVYAQSDTPTTPASPLSEWLPLIVTVIGGIAIIGVLVIAYTAVKGQRDSFPPGAAESWDRLYQKVIDMASKTQTPIDDILVAIGEPLAKSIGDALRGSVILTREVQPGGTVQGTARDPTAEPGEIG